MLIRRRSNAKSVKAASRSYAKNKTVSYDRIKYSVHYTEVNTTDGGDAFSQFEAQVSRISPYDDAEYAWASIKHGTIKYIRNGKIIDRSYYLNAEDSGIELSRWYQTIVDEACRNLNELNQATRPVMVHNSTDIETKSWRDMDVHEQRQLIKKYVQKYSGTKVFEDFADYVGEDIEDIIDPFCSAEERGFVYIPRQIQIDSKFANDDMYTSTDITSSTEAEGIELKDGIQEMDQEFTSENTSINSAKLPAIFKLATFSPNTLNVDYGGGRFDNVAEYLAEDDVTNLVYDPYNRTSEHNSDVLRQIRSNGGADSATCSNVLNVIKEQEVRLNVLNNIKKLVKPGGVVYITVYEGAKTNSGRATKSGYQLNRKTDDYLEEIQQVFPDAKRKGKLIVAHVESSTNITSAYGVTNRNLEPPEYDEPTYADDVVDEIYLTLDDVVTVSDDIGWDYSNTKPLWAQGDSKDGTWKSDTYPSLTLADSSYVVECVDELIEPLLLPYSGVYRIHGNVTLKFRITDVQTITDDEGREVYYIDRASIEFLKDSSAIDDFELTPMQM